MAFQSHFHIGRGILGWHSKVFPNKPSLSLLLWGLPVDMWEEISALGTSEGLAVHLRCFYEPHKLGIWDGNLLRITILTKFPIPLVFGRIKNSVEMAHVARLVCGAGQHQEEERPRKGKPNQCGSMFSRLSKGLGLAQTKKEPLRLLCCASSFKCHAPDSWSFEYQQEWKQGSE